MVSICNYGQLLLSMLLFDKLTVYVGFELYLKAELLERNMTKIFLIRDRKAFSTKWLCDFGSNLDDLGYEVSVVCDDKKYKPEDDVPLNKGVKKINLSDYSCGLSVFKFKKIIRDVKPDVAFAYFFIDLLNLSFSMNDTKVVMMFHNPPAEVFEKIKNPIKKKLFKILLKKTAAIQVLMPEFVGQVHDFVGDVKVDVIPNQVMIKAEEKDYSNNTKTIIHVAQIAEYNKRQHLLIEAFAKIANKHPEWKVHFFGKVKRGKHAAYYKRCLARVKELNLEDRLIFKGFSKNITQDYLNSEINTLPSRSEGFGYGLADGLALGLPSVGFSYAAAINEIIIDKKSGFLVSDVNEYADKLDALMSSDELRKEIGSYGRNDMQKRYSPEVVMGLWDTLIRNIVKNK
jgi:glycosyltransferase involved in cell wall biosynthesis